MFFATAATVVLSALAQTQSPHVPPLDCAAMVAAEMQRSATARFKEGEAALQASKWAEAEAAFLKAVASDSLLALAHYGLGQSYMSQQRFHEAVRAFTTSREAFRCTSGVSAEDRKRRTEEIHELREALRGVDQRRIKEIGAKWREMNGDVRTPGAGILSTQDLERRLAELESSLKDADPAPPGVTLALGTALFQTGSVAEAEVAFREVVARDPKSGDAHNNLALVCMLTGRLEEAEREVAFAKKFGVPVNPRLKQEIDRRKLEQGKRP